MFETALWICAGWICSVPVCVLGINNFLKTERRRLASIDRMVERAWRVVDRELNPPPPPVTYGDIRDTLGQRPVSPYDDLWMQLARNQYYSAQAQAQRASQSLNAALNNQMGMSAYQQQNAANSMGGLMGGALGLFGTKLFY